MAGDVTAKLDPYFPFERSVQTWGKSFARLGQWTALLLFDPRLRFRATRLRFILLEPSLFLLSLSSRKPNQNHPKPPREWVY